MNESYTESLYYQIRLTAKYLKMFSTQLFEKLTTNITLDEYVCLDLLYKEGKMCQRDLAKLLLKDRANTGRICNSLKTKGYIDILVEEKNNRPVKNLVLTLEGEKYLKELSSKIQPLINKLKEYSDEEEEKKLIGSLVKCREFVKKIVEIQI